MSNSGHSVPHLRAMELTLEGCKVGTFSIFLFVCLRVPAKQPILLKMVEQLITLLSGQASISEEGRLIGQGELPIRKFSHFSVKIKLFSSSFTAFCVIHIHQSNLLNLSRGHCIPSSLCSHHALHSQSCHSLTTANPTKSFSSGIPWQLEAVCQLCKYISFLVLSSFVYVCFVSLVKLRASSRRDSYSIRLWRRHSGKKLNVLQTLSSNGY